MSSAISNQEPVMINSKNAEVYKSKHGYHPCSYETMRKLRQLGFYYMATLHQDARRARWDAKKDVNRVRKVANFTDGQPFRWDRIPIPEPITFNLPGSIWAVTKVCRTPQQTPDDVASLPWTEAEIDGMVDAARAWYQEHFVKKS